MTSNSSTLMNSALCALLVFAAAGSAEAQAVNAPGTPLAGVCVYSENVILGQSQAGASANKQLIQIQTSVNAELRAARDKLVADDKALTARKATMSAAEFSQKTAELQTQARDLQNRSNVRNEQLTRTRNGAIAQISKAAVPILNASLAAHGCAIVLDKGAIYSVNPAMDLTAEVMQKVNAILPSVTISLAPPAL